MEFVGGQAVIEGVMIKGGEKVAIAVREPNGNIKVEEKISKSITKKYKILGLPLIRGPIILVETMILGLNALNFSANVAVKEEEGQEALGTFSIVVTLILSLVLALFLFKFVPLGAAQFLSGYSSILDSRIAFNLLEGLIKIGLLVGYIYIIGFMPDIRRVFQYHGAEHKVVNAWEHNDLANAKKYSTVHVRCGTSFILFVLLLSIVVYMFLPIDINFWAKYGLRILFLPVIAGLGYEFIKLSPKYEKNALFKIIMSPGLWLQKLTTREPDKNQLEVAKFALSRVTGNVMVV